MQKSFCGWLVQVRKPLDGAYAPSMAALAEGSQLVQQNLVETIKTHVKAHGNPDVVVITGDIAFSGKKNEYDAALDFFKELKDVLPKKTEFLPVPGNHDVDRDRIRKRFSLYQIKCQAPNLSMKLYQNPSQNVLLECVLLKSTVWIIYLARVKKKKQEFRLEILTNGWQLYYHINVVR